MNQARSATLGEKMTDYSNPNSFGSRMRARRMGPLIELIRGTHQEKGTVELLDAGGRKNYWDLLPVGFLQAHNVHVTILNLPEDLKGYGDDDEIFSHVEGNACDLSEYRNNHFDIVHSNSVIEHVGGWHNVKRFAAEMRRVAPALFIQTPNFWFPVEPHFVMPFIHWMPRPLRETIVRNFRTGHFGRRQPDYDAAISYIDEAARLLDRRAYRILFPDCEILTERFFLFPKSLIAIRPARGDRSR